MSALGRCLVSRCRNVYFTGSSTLSHATCGPIQVSTVFSVVFKFADDLMSTEAVKDIPAVPESLQEALGPD